MGFNSRRVILASLRESQGLVKGKQHSYFHVPFIFEVMDGNGTERFKRINELCNLRNPAAFSSKFAGRDRDARSAATNFSRFSHSLSTRLAAGLKMTAREQSATVRFLKTFSNTTPPRPFSLPDWREKGNLNANDLAVFENALGRLVQGIGSKAKTQKILRQIDVRMESLHRVWLDTGKGRTERNETIREAVHLVSFSIQQRRAIIKGALAKLGSG